MNEPDLRFACSCSFPHQPHDGCDGRPQAERLNDRPLDVFLWCRYDLPGEPLPCLFSVTYARPGDRGEFPVTQHAGTQQDKPGLMPMVRECSADESGTPGAVPDGVKVYGLLRLPGEVLAVHTEGDLVVWHVGTSLAHAVHLMQRLAGTLGWTVEVRPGNRLTGPTPGDFQRRYDLTVEPKTGKDLFGIAVEDLYALTGEDEHGGGDAGRPDPVRRDPAGDAGPAPVNPRVRGAGSRWRPARYVPGEPDRD